MTSTDPTHLVWPLFAADKNGRAAETVATVLAPYEADVQVIRWNGRFFAYQENGGIHVETTPFDASSPGGGKNDEG